MPQIPPTCAASAESSSSSAFCSLEGAAGAEEAEAVESVLVSASANVPLSELVLCGAVSVKLGSSSAGGGRAANQQERRQERENLFYAECRGEVEGAFE